MTLEISETTMRMLEAEAARQHTTPESLAENLVRRGLLTKKRDASHLAGGWTTAEVENFEKITATLQEVIKEDHGSSHL
jgi:hypothetical protein